MRGSGAPLVLAAVLLLAGVGPARAAVPADAEDLGRCGDDEPSGPLLLTFAPRDPAGLAALLRAQADPTSPDYHRWLTPAEFGTRFGAPAERYDAATRWLRRRGFHGVRTWPGRLGIAFEGTAGQVAGAFKTSLRAYRWRGRRHTAPEGIPHLPLFGAGPVALIGLDGFVRVRPGVRVGGADLLAPADVYTAHGVDRVLADGITGSGVTVAVIALSDFDAAAVALFRSTFGLPPVALTKRFAGANPGASDQTALGEVLLDTQWSGAIAPGAAIVAEVAPSDSAGGFAAAVTDLLNANIGDVLSVSLGVCEPVGTRALANAIGDLWSQAAAQGTSVFVSAGDDGVTDCRSQSGSLAPAVNLIAAPPTVTAVGGTQLNPLFDGNGDATGYGGESVWDDAASSSSGGAGGGGRSTFFAKPSYQSLPGLPADGTRDLPDVAFAASPSSPGYVLVGSTGILPFGIGGTSASAPVWAGFAALLVQKRGARLGLLNGELYELGADQAAGRGPAVFHDVTTGSNSVIGVPGFPAGPGYDLASGWGSFDAPALLAAFNPGTPCASDADCNDANACTVDTCAPGGCRHDPGADGGACRTVDCGAGVCAGGACTATGAASCDDGDPCTVDVCGAGGACQRSPAVGVAAVACVFAAGEVRAPACAGDRVPAVIDRAVARAQRMLARTTGRGRKSARLVRRTTTLLRHTDRVLHRATRRLSAACAGNLASQLESARREAQHLFMLLAP